MMGNLISLLTWLLKYIVTQMNHNYLLSGFKLEVCKDNIFGEELINVHPNQN